MPDNGAVAATIDGLTPTFIPYYSEAQGDWERLA